MTKSTIRRIVGFTLLIMAARYSAAAQDGFTNEEPIKAFLNENFSKGNVGMVVGIVDGRGSRIFGRGKLDNGTDQEVNGDTVFEIGSCTKAFTALLALDMARRGEWGIDDSVSRHLPERIKVPAFEGRPITLRHLAAQESGLPWHSDGHERIFQQSSGQSALKELKAAADAYTAEKRSSRSADDLPTRCHLLRFQTVCYIYPLDDEVSGANFLTCSRIGVLPSYGVASRSWCWVRCYCFCTATPPGLHC
jgi:CubicO group peptidase (beta-lactamase class C family)